MKKREGGKGYDNSGKRKVRKKKNIRTRCWVRKKRLRCRRIFWGQYHYKLKWEKQESCGYAKKLCKRARTGPINPTPPRVRT